MPQSVRGGAVTVSNGEENWLAHQITSFSSVQVLADNLALVADTLERHDVEHVVLEAETNRRRLVVVPSDVAHEARTALERELASAGAYVAPVTGSRVVRPRVIGHRPIPVGTPHLRVFKALCTPDRQFLSAADLGCDVQFWDQTTQDGPLAVGSQPVPAGTWIAPRRNHWIDVVEPDNQAIAARDVDGRPRATLSRLGHPNLDSVRTPIDIVYTWVDGSDPEWEARHARTLRSVKGTGAVNRLATNSSRYLSRDELKFSLRSVEMYAGWVNHVYLVTDAQMPPWLDASHPKITVVDHKDIFGEHGRLPTFNSHAIESQLHRIDGLSEHFLYLNDDVFFGRSVEPSRFVRSNGLTNFFPSTAKISLGGPAPEDWPVMAAGKRNRDLLVKAFGRQVTNKMKHVPHSMRRSVLAEIEQSFGDDHARTAGSQFRSDSDISIPSSLAHYYGYFTGRAVPGSIAYFYADIARPDTPARLERLLRKRNFDVFCLNDHDSTGVDPATQARMINTFLQQYFPLPSSFELASPGDRG
ncbi:stealth family protein [Terrabacter sp. RAF57]|uniref:stealth family protein n=1 Tax=Terrabacter sp. RAF57 TaxID=3233063 RepID=UPI003F9B9217